MLCNHAPFRIGLGQYRRHDGNTLLQGKIGGSCKDWPMADTAFRLLILHQISMQRKQKQHVYRQSDNYDDFISRHRHLRLVRLGFTPAVFPYCYEFEERESSAWTISSPGHLFYIFIVDKGLNVFNIDKQEFRLTPNSILIIPQECGFTSHTFGYTVRHVLELQGEILKNLEISQGMHKPILLDLAEDQDILDIIRDIGPQVDTDNASVFCRIMGRAYEILGRIACLIQKHRQGKTVIQQVLTSLSKEGTKKENMERLIHKLGLSRSTINRMVKKQLGMTPKEFCINMRLRKAIYLLEYTKNSIKEIAFSLGYCNPFYFSSDFKRVFGKSPTEYRRYIETMPYQRKRGNSKNMLEYDLLKIK